MKSKLLNDGPERTWAVVFDAGDAVVEGLTRFAGEHRLRDAHFTAIGAFRRATLYYFDWETKEYQEIPVEEQVEVLALTGNIVPAREGPKVHAHVVLGTREGNARGGHLKEATVRPTLEVILTEEPARLRRSFDPETGLTLLDLSGPLEDASATGSADRPGS
jgi:predicted DNA-binding protein with PD1-like motif